MSIEEYSNLFKALSHPLRLKIACGLMKKEECCVSNMVKKLGVSQPVISQHLSVMKSAGAIECFRKGNKICYKITNEKVKKIIQSMELCPCE